MSNNFLERDFPNLQNTDYEITSPKSVEYNCIAWAAGDTQAFWWPDQMNTGYWPPDVPRNESLDAFIKAFETLSYGVCDSPEYEHDFERIAIYVNSDGKPTHAAKQLCSGKWSSKIGRTEDIEHDIESVSGSLYGTVAVYMKRRKVF